jgi:type II secretory pathway component PulF
VHVTSIRVASELGGRGPAARRARRLKREIRLPRSCGAAAHLDRRTSNFTRQFATLLQAGTPLAECLQVLIEQAGGRRFEACCATCASA